MIVVTNTGPLIALASIDRLDLLPTLFGSLTVAATVVEECAAGGPIAVPDLRGLEWLTVIEAAPSNDWPTMRDLDRGERDTIAVALTHRAGLVIIDERIGRQAAAQLGLQITGTLGILAKAKTTGLIASFTTATDAMRKAGVRFHPALVGKIATVVGE